MKCSFHYSARKELNVSIEYYEECQVGLGQEFAEEVYGAIQRILEFPKAWAPFSLNTRRCLTNRFPYGIIYQILDDEILVIAVAQLSKKPNYWSGRIK